MRGRIQKGNQCENDHQNELKLHLTECTNIPPLIVGNADLNLLLGKKRPLDARSNNTYKPAGLPLVHEPNTTEN